jgi:hypothetical protein
MKISTLRRVNFNFNSDEAAATNWIEAQLKILSIEIFD